MMILLYGRVAQTSGAQKSEQPAHTKPFKFENEKGAARLVGVGRSTSPLLRR